MYNIEFEKNVNKRVQEILKHAQPEKKKSVNHDFKAVALFLGIAMGVVSSRFACLCNLPFA
jgi:hypothetical protein